MKSAALRKSGGWTKSIDAYLLGLAAAGRISSIALDDLRACIALCIDSDAYLVRIFLSIGMDGQRSGRNSCLPG